MSVMGSQKKTKLALKREIKQPDPFFSFLEGLREFFEKHKKNMLFSLGAIILVSIIYSINNYIVKTKENEVSLIEYEVSEILEGNNEKGYGKNNSQKYKTESDKNKAALEKYRRILKEYETTQNARRALLGVGNCLFRLGEYSNAAKSYQDFINKFPDSDFLYFVKRNLALCYESEGNLEKALVSFNDSLTDAVFPTAGKRSYLDIARIYEEQKKIKKAVEAYKKFVASSENSNQKEETKKKIELLGLKT